MDLLLFADDGGPTWGTIAAAVILALLPAAFLAPLLYAVFLRAAKRGYSRHAVQSFGLWILALAPTFGSIIVGAFAHYSPGDARAYRVVIAVFAMAAWSIAVIGFVFSLRGLRDTDKKRKHGRRRGNSFAVFGCTCNTLTLIGLLVGGAFYARYMLRSVETGPQAGGIEAARIFAEATRVAADALKNAPTTMPVTPTRAAPSNGDDTPIAPPPTLVGPAPQPNAGHVWFGTVFGKLPGDESSDGGAALVDYPALNFRMRAPGQGWVRLDPARAGPGVVVAYDLPGGKLRFIISADRPGVERGVTLEPTVEAARQRLRSVVPSLEFTAGGNRSVGGIDGRAFSATGKQGDESCTLEAWVAVHNGFTYELLLLASDRPPQAYAEESRRLFGLFEVRDAAQVAHAAEIAGSVTAVATDEFGFEVKTNDPAWTLWHDFAAEYQHADYGARYDAKTGFVVSSVRLDDTPVDRTAAAYALLTMNHQPYGRVAARPPKKVTQSNFQGEEFVWTAQGVGGGFRVARVLLGRGRACLLLGWCDLEGSPRYDALRTALDGVRVMQIPAGSVGTVGELSSTVRARSGRFYDEVGQYLLGEDQTAAAETQFAAAVRFKPDDASYLGHLVDALLVRRHYPEALAALEKQKDAVARSDALKVRQAEALADVGRRDEALRAYAALFRQGYVDDVALRRYVAMLESTSRWDEAMATVAAYRLRRNTPGMLALEARLISGRGDNFAAAKTLERHLSQSPTDAEPVFALADVYRKLQRPLDALQVIDRLIAGGEASASAYYWKGLAEYDLRRTRSSRDSFAQAHRLDPSDVGAKQMLDHVTRLLGEAENLRIRTPIDPVALPASIVDAVPTSPMPDDFARAAAYYLDHVVAYQFVPGEDYRRTEYHTIRVLTAQGVDELNTLTVRFDPLSEEVFVNRLDVYDNAGRPTAAGDVATYYLVDEASGGAATGDRILELPVPGLRPGYRIELVATVRSFIKRTKFPYLQTFFGLKYPVRRQALLIASDLERLAWSGTHADTVRREATGVWWQAVDLPAFRREPFSPEPAETEPSLFVADKRNTWESEATEYVEEISELRNVPPIVGLTAQEMTKGLEGTEAKLLALAAFVQREIAYQPVAFGRRSRVPQSPDKTLANRFGDGKDMSLLLAQMLAAVGVDTRLALVNLNQPVQSKLPTLDQFDHMVVLIPQGESGRVIDATDKEADARLSVPLRLAGRDALIIDDRKPRLVRLPRPPLDSYRADVKRTVKFDAAGTANVGDVITFHDYYAAAMRGRLRYVAAADRAAFWQEMLREGGTPAVVRSLKIDKLDDLTEPLVVTCQYDVERALVPLGTDEARQWAGAIPAAFEATILTADASESRRRPFDFRYALHLTTECDVEPPTGLAPPSVADPGDQVDSDLLSAKRTSRADPSHVKFAFELNRPVGRYAPTRYEDYREALRDARAVATPTVRFAPAAAK